eukprot:4882601-Pleurochrysis_carterae.AAC.2
MSEAQYPNLSTLASLPLPAPKQSMYAPLRENGVGAGDYGGVGADHPTLDHVDNLAFDRSGSGLTTDVTSTARLVARNDGWRTRPTQPSSVFRAHIGSSPVPLHLTCPAPAGTSPGAARTGRLQATSSSCIATPSRDIPLKGPRRARPNRLLKREIPSLHNATRRGGGSSA